MLDKAQLSPEAVEAKKKASEELVKMQWALRACSAEMSEEQQKKFATDVEAAMRSASAQVFILFTALCNIELCTNWGVWLDLSFQVCSIGTTHCVYYVHIRVMYGVAFELTVPLHGIRVGGVGRSS